MKWKYQMDYAENHAEFIKMLSESEPILDCPLRRTITALHRIDTSYGDLQQIHARPYRAAQEAPEFEKNEFAMMLELEVIELPQTKWASTIVFAHIGSSAFQFCLD